MQRAPRFPWFWVFTHPLTKGAPLSAFWRIASWQLRSRLREEIIVDWVRGQKLCVSRGMRSATGNIYVGMMEFPEMMFTLHFLRPDDLFVDIGANVGVFSVLAAGGCGCRSIACEPAPKTFSALKKNIGLNGLEDRVELHQVVVGAEEGKAYFTTELDQINHVVAAAGEGVMEQTQRTLDGLVGDRMPIMLKIDVEGHEKAVIDGAGTVLRKPGLVAMQVETVSQAMEDDFAELGFAKYYYNPFTRQLATRSLDGIKNKNSLYIRDLALVEQRIAAAEPVTVLGERF